MVVSGIKTEEYREIKPHWVKRLLNADGSPKHFDAIKFRNGYKKSAPSGLLRYQGLESGRGRPEWGAPLDKDVFKLKLGDVLNVNHGGDHASGNNTIDAVH